MKKLLFLLLICSISQVHAHESKLPNIILIYADDLGIGLLGHEGQKIITTPNIDQLAREGMRFKNAYSNMFCAPARASLLSGYTDIKKPNSALSFSFTHGKLYQKMDSENIPLQSITDAIDNTFPAPPKEQVFLAQIAQSAGYTTAQFGKLDWGFSTTPNRLKRHGWDEHLGFMDHVNAHGFYPPYLFENGKIKYIEGNTIVGGGKSKEPETAQAFKERWNRQGKEVYSQDIFIDAILKKIRTSQNSKKNNKPFFIYFPTQLPHGPVSIPQVHKDFLNDSRLTQIEKEYASMVKRLDDDVGLIIEEVKAQGIEDNTIIIFTADNGHEIYYSQHGRAEKPYRDVINGKHFDNYKAKFYSERAKDVFNGNGSRAGLKQSNLQGGINVPLIVKWPSKIAANTTSDRLVASYDMLPTIAEIVNYQANLSVDGLSYYQSFLGDNKRQAEKHNYIVYSSFEGPMLITQDGWKIRSVLKHNTFELFYLPDDKAETNNLAYQEKEKFSALKDLLLKACYGDLKNGFYSWKDFALSTSFE